MGAARRGAARDGVPAPASARHGVPASARQPHMLTSLLRVPIRLPGTAAAPAGYDAMTPRTMSKEGVKCGKLEAKFSGVAEAKRDVDYDKDGGLPPPPPSFGVRRLSSVCNAFS